MKHYTPEQPENEGERASSNPTRRQWLKWVGGSAVLGGIGGAAVGEVFDTKSRLETAALGAATGIGIGAAATIDAYEGSEPEHDVIHKNPKTSFTAKLAAQAIEPATTPLFEDEHREEMAYRIELEKMLGAHDLDEAVQYAEFKERAKHPQLADADITTLAIMQLHAELTIEDNEYLSDAERITSRAAHPYTRLSAIAVEQPIISGLSR